MSFFDIIKPLIKICHILGLAPYSRIVNTSEWTKNRQHETVTLGYLIIIVAILVTCIIFNGSIVDHTESGLFVAIFNYSIVIICWQTIIVLCETFVKRNQHISLLNIFEKLELILEQNNIRLDGIRLKRILNRAIFFWILETVSFFTLGIVIWLKSRQYDDMYFFLSQTLPQLISKLSFVFWITSVIVLQENVNALIKHTELFIKNADDMKWDRKTFRFFNGEYRGAHMRLSNQNLMEYLKQCYILIWDASIFINNIVVWSFPVGFLNEFSVLVFNCFFVIKNLQSPPFFITQILHISSWAAMNLINIIFVFIMCGKTVETVISIHQSNHYLAKYYSILIELFTG